MGTQYRSAIYFKNENNIRAIIASKEQYQKELNKKNLGLIETEIKMIDTYFFAEDYHQQYLHKVPNGYCGLAGCNVRYPDVANLT